MVGQHISKYRVTEQIGRGGMGTVYRAIDETLHREVAIKVLNTELNDPTVARRFRAEAVTVARLNHPGIATIYELLQHEGQWLMVMEFVRGETLERLCSRKGSLPVDQAADLCMQTLSALAHAHSLGVVHRDLKPANLMVTDGGSIKIMDFGIARVAGTEHLTSAGFMMGTPAYMAPEQVLGQEIDARTDLYATGVVLYHLTTGRLPFKGDTPLEMAQSRINDTPTPARSVREDLPAWLAQVLDISLTRAPERRFQTALLFREALRRGLANLPIETPAPAAPPPELIATAAPRSLPIATAEPLPVAAQIPRTTPPPAAEMPTMATSRPSPPAATASKSSAASRVNTTTLAIAGLAALVVIVVGASWMHRRSASEPPSATDAAAVQTPASDPASSAPPPTADNAASQPAATPGASPASPTPSAPISTTPDASTPPVVPASAGPALSTPSPAAPSTPASGVAPVDGRSSAPASAARGSGRGRGRGVINDTPAAFPDLRAFVVTGRKAEEESAVLRFESGAITLAADKGSRVFARMPYTELTSAAFVRAKNPRWYPTLAGPPANVDMPGGLFRSSRGWLALQSRNGYLIVRLNDDTLRRVLDTVTERTGVKVEQLPSQ
jgi:serine/threonine-protein kinase